MDEAMALLVKRRGVLPGFAPSIGFTITYLGLVVLIPLSTMVLKSAGVGWSGFYDTLSSGRVLASFRLSFTAAFAAASINAVFGLLVSWVLVRYEFPGKGLVDAVVDLPFALPTAVGGIALTTVYAENGPLGTFFYAHGIKTAFSPLGIVIALTFIGLPFAVRTVQPVLQELEPELEEAASSLGASRLQAFTRVILPIIMPSLLTGFALAFARALGEYGSVVFISGNMPFKTEIAPLLIMTKLEQFDVQGATVVATVMLAGSFITLFCINILQWLSARRAEG